jgi:hypothetical protein
MKLDHFRLWAKFVGVFHEFPLQFLQVAIFHKGRMHFLMEKTSWALGGQ